MDFDSASILAKAGVAIRTKGWGTEHRLIIKNGKAVRKISDSIHVELTEEEKTASYFICDRYGVSLEMDPQVSAAETKFLNAVKSTRRTTQMKVEERR